MSARVLVGYVISWRDTSGQLNSSPWSHWGGWSWTDKQRARVFASRKIAKDQIESIVYTSGFRRPVLVARYRKALAYAIRKRCPIVYLDKGDARSIAEGYGGGLSAWKIVRVRVIPSGSRVCGSLR